MLDDRNLLIYAVLAGHEVRQQGSGINAVAALPFRGSIAAIRTCM